MNPEDYSRTDLITADLAWGWLLVGTLLLAAVWILSLKFRDRFESRTTRLWFFIVGSVVATVAVWLCFQFLGKFFALATPWSLWVLAALAGLAAETIVWLYRLERTLVIPESRGRWLLGLRLAALALLIAILLQPVRSFLIEREINREVAVLIDDSQSMQLADQRLTPTEVLDRAQLFGVPGGENRPPIFPLIRRVTDLRDRVASEQSGLETAPDPAAAVESRNEILTEFLSETTREATSLQAAFIEIVNRHPKLPGNVRNHLNDFKNRLGNQTKAALDQAGKQLEAKNAQAFQEQLKVAREQFDYIVTRIPGLTGETDDAFYAQLSEADRSKMVEAAARPRSEVARELLTRAAGESESTEEGRVDDQTLLDQLGNRYNLRFYRFAREPREIANAEEAVAAPEKTEDEENAAKPDATTSQTDLAGALDHILENSSPESLAGIFMLTDGRHNGPALPEDALRQLAVQSSPVCAIPIGGRIGPVDASVLSLTAPESIYLGDRIVVKSEIKLDGLRGQRVKAILRHNGEEVDSQTISVPDVNYRTELRFVDLPEDKGIFNYQLELEPIESELFSTNNYWDFKVAVTDDRTNVLLVDGFPRWEFRYLRNLFYGRDKSVHLQYVLQYPDQIDGMKNLNGVPASATRKFGEAEAESLPNGEEEWRLFDVIILGDVPPATLGPAEWRYINDAVTQRGALLVCIAGPRYMPHAHENEMMRDLMPVTWEHSDEENFDTPEDEYRVALTNSGRSHPVMEQSSSRSLNSQLWGSMPNLRWRTVSTGVKESAEVLAFAQPLDGGAPASAGSVSLDGSPGSVEEAIRQLANRKAFEAEHALVTIQRAGLGKVAMLNFDRTWRFRFGVGDTYHHRFWGQLLRWGAGENLRSGNRQVRLGTDRLTYTPADPVNIVARVFDEERRPVTDADIYASVHIGERRLLRQKMSYRTGSSGIYETSVASLSDPGEYTVKLEGAAVESALQADEENPLDELETELLVVTTRNPIELAELTADRDFLNRAAQITGGRVAEIPEAFSLVEAFGAPKETLTERRNITLWDKWPMLVLFFGLVTTEWVLRRKSGLA